ncbi:calcium-binding protein [Falsiruegeria mediterranea]
MDFLTLDYTGQLYNGETATRVSLQLQSSNTDLVYFGTTFFGFRLDGFERFDITATAGDDYIYTHTGAYNDTIRGGAGNDTIHANGGNDVIEGGAGDDHITGGDGADVLNGGSGDDRFYGVNSGDVIVGGSGVDEVTFDLSSDTTGASFDLAAGLGANGSWTGIERITGTFGSGDDTVVAGAQVQNLNGGSGVDFLTLDYTGQLYNGETATRVSLQLQSSNTDLVYFGTTFFGFRLDGFERFDITATAGDDYIYTHTGAYNDTIRGGAGNDTIHANGGNDVIEGGAGDDHITGGDGADVLNGGSGDDRFYGVNSGDVIVGGSGVDEVTFDLSSDTTGASFDLAAGLGANGSWTGIERITGTFGSGDDTVVAGAQVQNLNGGSGVDFLTLDYTGQLYNGETATRVSLQLQSSNTDLVYFGTTFFGFRLDGFERFDITATAGDDYIYTHTGAYNDTIRGGAGNDTIHANGGNDVIEGGAGDDRIDGGDGYDWLVLGIGNDTVDGGADRDMVSFSDLPEVAGRTNLDFMLTLDLGAGTANLFGGETNTLNSIERVTGSIFTDVMRGSDGNDELRGIGDYDWFIATPGNDTLDGGNGLDMVSFVEGTYSGATVVQDVFSVDGAPPSGAAVGGVLLDLTTPADNVGLADGLTLISVERVTGSSHQDVFYGDSNQNDFRGLGGYDWFVSSTGGRERYFGGDGLDTVTYFQSTDGVGASLRNSSYIVSGQETGYGTAGDAVRDLFYEIENLVGSNYDDSLTGNEERNQLAGLDGDDIIFGYGNIDYIKGGAGNDMINGGAGSDFALYDGNRADYTITRTSSTEVEIAGGGFTDFLENVEYFQFDDETANIWQFSVA